MSLRMSAGTSSAVVDARAGGRLASLVIGGRERLVTIEDPSALLPAVSWGSFAMVPWVGRMSDGRLSWRGTDVQLARDFGAHAIHGTTYDAPWEVLAADQRSVEIGCRLGPSGRWPFAAEARQRFVLEPDALTMAIEVDAEEAMPVAAGWHPWFVREGGEPIVVRVPAPGVLETGEGLIPTGRVVPVGPATDLRRPRDVGSLALDHAYVGVEGRCSLAWRDLELTFEAMPLRSVVVYTTQRSVCLESQSAWPDAIRLDGDGVDAGLVALGAGERFVVETRWSWRTLEAGSVQR